MSRNGIRVFDTDTHVGPSMDILENYMSSSEKADLEQFSAYRRKINRYGHVAYQMGARTYRRQLGQAAPPSGEIRPNRAATADAGGGSISREAPDANVDVDVNARIRDMDREGVDVNLTLPSGWFGTWTTVDVQFEMAAYRAYHRWMADYCGAYPDRIAGVILVSGRDVEGSLAELKRHANQRWPLAVFCYAPAEMPLDHPQLEPFWAAAQDYDLSVVLHTFTSMPPYAPGGQDTWDNLWLQKTTAHPWCGMRNLAAFIGSGILDRWPDLRLGLLEAGHGWLPFWASRLDEYAGWDPELSGQAAGIRDGLPPLEHKPSDYITSGRFFQSIDMAEGEAITRSVIDLLGEDVLMYASDYPHTESKFPVSVDTVMAWGLPQATKQKLFWDNPVRFYRRYSGKAIATT